MTMTDQHFLQQFENKTLNAEHFDHLGQLPLAWLYLANYPEEQAIKRITFGISEYAKHLGAPEKFNYTQTVAVMKIIHVRMANPITHESNILNITQDMGSHESFSFDRFIKINSDLVTDLPELVALHYSEASLLSELAKQRFIAPDRAPFPIIEYPLETL